MSVHSPVVVPERKPKDRTRSRSPSRSPARRWRRSRPCGACGV